jgi:hypothetical protein
LVVVATERGELLVAVIDGLPGSQAIAYVREHYEARAVETPRQRRFASRFQQH